MGARNDAPLDMISNDDQGDQTESLSKIQALWLNNGFQRRYACDRCRGHKLRCNRDPMASRSKPCQRCTKAKVPCTIGSSFRPGKQATQKQEQSKQSTVSGGDEAGHSARSSKGSAAPPDDDGGVSRPRDSGTWTLTADDIPMPQVSIEL